MVNQNRKLVNMMAKCGEGKSSGGSTKKKGEKKKR